MSLAEGVQGVISYKQYALGTMTATTEDQAPGTSGAQTLRRVASTLNLRKQTYASAEVRPDRQIGDFRHGPRRVDGDISGELSPATYTSFIEAVHRDTKAVGISASQADFTSITASASGSAFTMTGGDPVAKGFLIGDLIRFTGNTAVADNAKNFVITGFSGGSNRVVAVTPAPVDSTISSTFTMIGPGKSTIVPASGHVSRKFAIEVLHQDLGQSRVFTELRATKYALSLPATGMATITNSFLGRDQLSLTGGASPYFIAPAAITTTGIIAAVSGSLLLGGVPVGVVTGLTIQCDLAPTPATVTSQNFAAEVFLSHANVTGQITAYMTDTSFFDNFANEVELELLVRLDTTLAANTPSMVFYLPRIKLGTADLALTGESGQMITSSYQALRFLGVTPGKTSSTIRCVDTDWT